MSGHKPPTVSADWPSWAESEITRLQEINADMHTLLKRIRKMLSDERRSHPLGLGPDARTGWIDEIDGVIGSDTGNDARPEDK